MRVECRRHQQVGRGGGERAGGGRERADQAVARERARAVGVGDAARQHRVLERHQHAGVAGLRIDGADERHQQHEGDVLDLREHDPGRDHQRGAEHQHDCADHAAARRSRPRASAATSRAAPRSRRMPISTGREADRREIGRQDDDGEAVAEAAHAARGIEQIAIRSGRSSRSSRQTSASSATEGDGAWAYSLLGL